MNQRWTLFLMQARFTQFLWGEYFVCLSLCNLPNVIAKILLEFWDQEPCNESYHTVLEKPCDTYLKYIVLPDWPESRLKTSKRTYQSAPCSPRFWNSIYFMVIRSNNTTNRTWGFIFGALPMAYHRPGFFLCHRHLADRRAAHPAVATRPGESGIAHQWRAISFGPCRRHRRPLGLGHPVGHRILLGSFQRNPWLLVRRASRYDRFFPPPTAPGGRRGHLGRNRTPS